MVLEIATIQIVDGQCAAFEAAFKEALPILEGTPGYISHSLQRCMEDSHRYALLIEWRTREDHTVGFRQGPNYAKWAGLLHHYYVPFPTIEHFVKVE
jgi:heme-degrading monooxygenase HmoA